MMRNRVIQIIDENGGVVWQRRFDESLFTRLQRVIELLPDKEALVIMDKVIKDLEAPKIEMAKRISKELIKDGDMTKFLQEALTALPMKELNAMEKKMKKLTMKREPGGDCLLINDGKKSTRLHL